jgi:hypothetical protein
MASGSDDADSTFERRAVLAGVLPATMALCAAINAEPVSAAATLSPLDNTTRTWLRLVSDPSGSTTFAITEGSVWGFRPQADDLTVEAFAKRLYGYRSLLARKASRTAEGAISLKSKAWSFYLDPLTGKAADHIFNPYTEVEVACPPLSGPVSTIVYGGAGASRPPLDLTQKRIGDHAFVTVARVARFKPADTTWFKLEADFTSYACRTAELDREDGGFIPSTWSHNLVAEWQTWMKMHGTPGHILFKGDGAYLRSLDAAPPDLPSAIERFFPGTLGAVRAWT